jgi:hypothetical protein
LAIIAESLAVAAQALAVAEMKPAVVYQFLTVGPANQRYDKLKFRSSEWPQKAQEAQKTGR